MAAGAPPDGDASTEYLYFDCYCARSSDEPYPSTVWQLHEINKETPRVVLVMVLNIRNPEIEKLARELARRRKQGITEALTDVLRKEVERERKKPQHESKEEFHRAIQEIVDRVKNMPVLDDRPADEILGYDKHGLPK